MPTARTTITIITIITIIVVCADRSSSRPSFFDRASTEVRSALCEAGITTLTPLGQDNGQFSRARSWRITIPLSWEDYTEHVVARLNRQMRVVKRSKETLLLRETLPGDVMTLQITLVDGSGGKTIVEAELRGTAW